MNKDPYEMRSWELRRWRRFGVITQAQVLWYIVAGAAMAINKWLGKPRISMFDFSLLAAWGFALLLTQTGTWQRTSALAAVVVYWVAYQAVRAAITFHENSTKDKQERLKAKVQEQFDKAGRGAR